MTLLLRSSPCLRAIAIALPLVAILAAQAVAFRPCAVVGPIAAYHYYPASVIAITAAAMGAGNNDTPPLRKWGKPGGASPASPLRKWGKPASSSSGGSGGASPASSSAPAPPPAPAEIWDQPQPGLKRTATTTSDVYTYDTTASSSTSTSSGIPVPKEATSPESPAIIRTTGTPECQRIQTLVDTHKLLMFMNGSQANSKCENSDTAAKVLERLCGAGSVTKDGNVRNENLFVTVDVTDDSAIRQGLQEYNPEWDAAIPQLYVNGEFKGGADTMLKMFNTGEFQRLINEIESQ